MNLAIDQFIRVFNTGICLIYLHFYIQSKFLKMAESFSVHHFINQLNVLPLDI